MVRAYRVYYPAMPRTIPPLRPLFAFPGAFLSLLLAVLFTAGDLHAHANGTSKIYIRLHGNDSITVELDANTSDMIQAVGSDASPYQFDTVPARIFQERAANYFYSRLSALADNRTFLSPHVLLWKRGGTGPADDLVHDSAALWDTTLVMTFGGRHHPNARLLHIQPAIFPEFGVQTICEASVYWKDTLIERRWLTLDKSLRIPLSADSLDARLVALHGKPEAASGGNLFWRFIVLGYKHIMPAGMDHILFILGLFFFSTRLRPLLFQVTAFTVAHSITLALTLLGLVSLPAVLVNTLIALSIAVVGIENVFLRNVRASRWLVVFAFGLFHGMGFANMLGKLGLPEGGFWPALIGFNVGVEFGQLSVIAIALALTVWFRNKPWYFKGVVVPASLLISAVGLYWAVQAVWRF
jgi:hypothetical protein